jgi:hypothetical protein
MCKVILCNYFTMLKNSVVEFSKKAENNKIQILKN